MQLPFLPSAFTTKRPPPQWDPLTPALARLSKSACTHPIHTISIIALIASTTYVSMLESSLFDRTIPQWGNGGYTRRTSIIDGSVNITMGPQTNWEWVQHQAGHTDIANHVALITLWFHTGTTGSSIPIIPQASTASQLPCDEPMKQAYVVKFSEVPEFFQLASDISTTGANGEKGHWVMTDGSTRADSRVGLGMSDWAKQGASNFGQLVKNADPLDVAIMFLGYLSMHLTFISLFLSMRRLGSNFWLAATVLFSSTFAFLFASIVTHKLGVPINVILLSEGLPFLVVTIGFEKPIILTRAVLEANNHQRKKHSITTIPSAVAAAVQDCGFEIVRDYIIEIAILCLGALCGVQGGLRQFCFLAAWILAFDCIMLFTFFTAILTIKLEIIRIKRHLTTVKALEEDGVSSHVAEKVASTNECYRAKYVEDHGTVVFGKKVKDSSLIKFKVLMVTGFVLVNLANLFTLPYRDNASSTVIAINPEVRVPKVDWGLMKNSLDGIRASGKPVLVTVLHPIEYELHYHSIYTSATLQNFAYGNAYDGSELFVNGVRSKVVESILKSLEDPVLSKWIIFALSMSLVLNGYLFNAARWSVKDLKVQGQNESKAKKDHPQVAERIVAVNCTCGGNPQQSLPSASDTRSDQSGRTVTECEALLKQKRAAELTNAELVEIGLRGIYPTYSLERLLGNSTRAVVIRRSIVSRTKSTLDKTSELERSLLPFANYNYDRVLGACCENVIGYLPLPLGVAGPLSIDAEDFYIPMATTEGVLIASTHRGCKAINSGGGAVTVITGDGMTRGPVVEFPNVVRTGSAKNWIDSEMGQKKIKQEFDSTSRFARLQSIKCAIAGRKLFIRFKTTTGDAMGMNMISKGVEHALYMMSTEYGFEDMTIISVSGNYCTDKKPAAINWTDGRGKSVVAEAIIPTRVVEQVLKTTVDAMLKLNYSKNLVGSAMAGSVGGFNAHAANIVAAVFLATGQDPAQVVESANCITLMEKTSDGHLSISVTMPCVEVGTIGGGTILEPQSAMLDLLGVRGAHLTNPGDNARKLARIIAASVLAGELSLCSALAAGHLVRSHMAHNRSQPATRAPTPANFDLKTTNPPGLVDRSTNASPRSGLCRV